MPNRVFINTDGYIEQIYSGDQSKKILTATVRESVTLMDRLRRMQQPVYVLVDTTDLGRLATASRTTAVEALKNITYDKIAIYGTDTFKKALINLIIHAAGKGHKIKIFSTRVEAQLWLSEQSKQATRTKEWLQANSLHKR